ncbi:unnamed protein product [Paramecium octaurelia]|uniref:Transmembrane protein n=1 Tax=Paramecium octaurelia TaxID=43137 RepID=A0A8S1VKJ5_PAROT|nr:unnamed protein product [Paramecium octaurelia]
MDSQLLELHQILERQGERNLHQKTSSNIQKIPSVQVITQDKKENRYFYIFTIIQLNTLTKLLVSQNRGYIPLYNQIASSNFKTGCIDKYNVAERVTIEGSSPYMLLSYIKLTVFASMQQDYKQHKLLYCIILPQKIIIISLISFNMAYIPITHLIQVSIKNFNPSQVFVINCALTFFFNQSYIYCIIFILQLLYQFPLLDKNIKDVLHIKFLISIIQIISMIAAIIFTLKTVHQSNIRRMENIDGSSQDFFFSFQSTYLIISLMTSFSSYLSFLLMIFYFNC